VKSKTAHEQREGIKKLERFLESPESDALRLMDQIARVSNHLNQLIGDDDIDDVDNINGNTENTKTTDNDNKK